MFKVSNVRIHRVDNPEGKTLAFATITVCGVFVVKDLRIVEGDNGLFAAMPQRKSPDGAWVDVAHPITREARNLIQEAVLAAYAAASTRQAAEAGG